MHLQLEALYNILLQQTWSNHCQLNLLGSIKGVLPLKTLNSNRPEKAKHTFSNIKGAHNKRLKTKKIWIQRYNTPWIVSASCMVIPLGKKPEKFTTYTFQIYRVLIVKAMYTQSFMVLHLLRLFLFQAPSFPFILINVYVCLSEDGTV